MPCDYNACHQILRNTRADVFISESSSSFQKNFYQWIAHTEYEEYMKQVGGGLSIDVNIPIKGIPLGQKLSGSTTKEEYKRIQKAINDGIIDNIDETERQKLIKHNTNPEIYKSWLDCMTEMIRSCSDDVEAKVGLYVKEISRSGQEIIINIKYTPAFPQDPPPKVESFSYPEDFLECKEGCLKKDDVIEGEHVIILKRQADTEGMIVINTTRNTLLIPINRKFTATGIERAKEKLSTFIRKSIEERGGVIMQHETFSDGTVFDMGPIVTNIDINSGIWAAFKIEIPSMTARIDENGPLTASNRRTLYTGFVGQVDLLHPEMNQRAYCLELVADISNFCVGADQIANVINSSFDDQQ
ncbi:hypothetical protein [Bacillus subtilis]|uniref:hypothetical protein n=1 Tax=Bacillus subtilis TaxID=1423 RepID=UPI0013F5A732|nr:hypothetical protein [Bacillus subtilis]MCS4324196.1 hypothetical protein [Bacillus subtilis]NQE94964.1 hypothetical protein [Bacillus subtilis]WIT27411.1 hypothetical protein [Bacillus phage SPbetaL4]WIT28161.1 hypothetical protein [Bacillus phage SPbetaL8]